MSQKQLKSRNTILIFFYEKVRDFVVAIKENTGAPIPGEQILINQAIIDGILRSAELGKEVEIEPF